MSNSDPTCHRVAYFISPHGFGHATRSAAVMSAIHEIASTVQFEIFTTVPLWLFQQSLSGGFTYHSLLTDVGLVQKNSLNEDIEKTLESLDAFVPLKRSLVIELAGELQRMECKLVICDISPMGVAVAKEAGIPSVLIENFTWDWIYEGYAAENNRLYRHINYLRELFVSADYRIQAEPVCRYGDSDLVVNPISRKPRASIKSTRETLEISESGKVVLITMGEMPGEYAFLKKLERVPNTYFVIPGGSENRGTNNNVILLPHQSDFFHPDLINASDLVIGKLGYSTLAEAYYARIPFGHVLRPEFRESEIMAKFVKSNMKGFSLTEEKFHEADWLRYLPDYLNLQRTSSNEANGADQAARFILELLEES